MQDHNSLVLKISRSSGTMGGWDEREPTYWEWSRRRIAFTGPQASAKVRVDKAWYQVRRPLTPKGESDSAMTSPGSKSRPWKTSYWPVFLHVIPAICMRLIGRFQVQFRSTFFYHAHNQSLYTPYLVTRFLDKKNNALFLLYLKARFDAKIGLFRCQAGWRFDQSDAELERRLID